MRFYVKIYMSVKFQMVWCRIDVIMGTYVQECHNCSVSPFKPTSSLAYLHRNSCHPRQVFTSLPYGEFLRVRRNCSDNASFDLYAARLKQAFCNRGYDPQEFQTALDKARNQDRTQLLSKGLPTDILPLVSEEETNDEAEPSTPGPSFLVLTHHPENQVFRQIISNNWDLLGASDTTRYLYDAGFKIGSGRNRRLRDILVHSSIPLPHKRGKQGKRINECPETTCIFCDSIDKSGHIHSHTTKHESKYNICCQSSNLVYCLQCYTCGKQYVGQTKRKLLERLREHFNNIRKNTKTTGLVVISIPPDITGISSKSNPLYLPSSHYLATLMAHSRCA